jgi:hypothetical protein
MTGKKAPVRRDSKQIAAIPPRLASYTRVRSPVVPYGAQEEASAPSTLPPPPFSHEAGVVGLEWWLEAHMEIVGQLAVLEQLLDVGDAGMHGRTMELLAGHVEAVRDALYELYCDAADERLAPLLEPGALLGQHVRCCYAWLGRVVALLGTLVQGMRSEAGPDWGNAKTGFRSASVMYVGPSDSLRIAVMILSIDTTSPTEPLRNLPADLEALFAVNERLQSVLATRFT